MIGNILRFFIFLFLVNLLLGFVIKSNDNQRIYHLLKQRSAENDNEFVWFTRDIPNEDYKLKQQEDLFPWKIINRKYPFNINPTYKIE
jgi:hypothetical protein